MIFNAMKAIMIKLLFTIIHSNSPLSSDKLTHRNYTQNQ